VSFRFCLRLFPTQPRITRFTTFNEHFPYPSAEIKSTTNIDSERYKKAIKKVPCTVRALLRIVVGLRRRLTDREWSFGCGLCGLPSRPLQTVF
jgi:hypothetical protein